jgi:hypothetical protein
VGDTPEGFSIFILFRASEWGLPSRIEASVKRKSGVLKGPFGSVIDFPAEELKRPQFDQESRDIGR